MNAGERPEPCQSGISSEVAACTRTASAAKVVRSARPARLYLREALLEEVAYTLKYMVFGFRPLASALKPIMGQECPFTGSFPNFKRHVLEILC